jgi:hypothetical protein
VKGWLLAGALVALAVPPLAAAHVTVLPSFLEAGKRTTLVFASPNERPPHAVTRLTVTAPDGVDLAAGPPTPGWTTAARGPRAVWSGGRTLPGHAGEFRVAATTRLAPGGVVLVAVQRYDDGKTVRWTIPFTILPGDDAPAQHLWPALIAGAVGVVAITGGLAYLRLRRAR